MEDKKIEPSENKQAQEDMKKTEVGVSPPKRKRAQVDFAKDEARVKNAKAGDYPLVGGCGISIIDKKEFTLPNGLKVEN